MKIAPHICIALMVLAMMFLLGCTHKELCYDHSHVNEVNVYFNWNAAPDAEPESMGLYIYPNDGSSFLRFEITNHLKGRIRIKDGNYNAICLNSDTYNIDIKNKNDFYGFEITTKEMNSISGQVSLSTKSIPRAKGAEEERIVASPEIIWSDANTNNIINSTNTFITMAPECIVKNCKITINNAENLEWVKSISATISSMSGGYHPHLKSLTDDKVTLAFDCSFSSNNKQIIGKMTTFGCCPNSETSHKLTIYAILKDNTKWYCEIDVTEQMHNQQDPYNIIINLEELPIPKPEGGESEGSGFTADVEEWNVITYDIKM